MGPSFWNRILSQVFGKKESGMQEEYRRLRVRRLELEGEKDSLKAKEGCSHEMLEIEKELAMNKDRCEYLEHVLRLKTVDDEVKADLSLLAKEELGRKKAEV